MSILKVPVSDEDHIQGEDNSAITLIEYGDYECPYCGLAYPIVKQLQKHFNRELRFVFRNFPLAEVHPYAKAAAETAEFADSSERFWEMHDLIYENQADLSLPMLIELTEKLELPVLELELAIEKQIYEPKIRKDFLGGVRSGVNGTPTFFINDHRYNGPITLEDLVSVIDSIDKGAK
jgi:protein-disulfide isomerase